MWEDAAPMQEREPPRPPARPRSEEDLVLWAQILLCLAAVGFVLAAKLLGWPAYPVLRRAFAAATQPEQSLLLGVHWKRNPTTCRLCLGGTFLSVKRLNYRQR